MITADALGAKIAGRLSNIKPVIPGVLRGERTDVGGHPYAVYFFALSDDLKDWADRGRRIDYFEIVIKPAE